ncbi:tryptophan halogenase family protein [Ideonella sp. DXS22W]|uniref:Tryptophan halogenase family protein n=1 Tax=Pseudaquabacterium inlustre TaxID=2984192 RepID=A0ABU9CM96_9BURK
MGSTVNDAIRHVVVLGGGSAGWLVAGLIAAEHRAADADGLRVTLVESSELPPIGVGEGTWPTMRDTLRRIGLPEDTLVRDCDASFKQGSRFDGWVDGTPGDIYHHPFSLPQGHGDVDLVGCWLARHADMPFAHRVSHQPALCDAGRAPKQAATPEYAAVANYGYHFDAGKFGLALRAHAVQRLGVHHIVDEVLSVRCHTEGAPVGKVAGDIAALVTRGAGDGSGEVRGDLFIDCSGLAARLIGQHYGVPLRSARDVLFNDRALALQVPYAQPEAPIASQTIATARPHGWIWDIGLPTRRGVGHVYSSTHARDEQAAEALLDHVRATAGPAVAQGLAPRAIRFEPGHRARFWQHNCVAVGLSSGFIEPLEASALALVELSATMICDEMPATRGDMDIVARRFNERFEHRWQRVIEFLKLHYVLSRRDDAAGSRYWADHRDTATWPERLREQLQLWRSRPPYRHDFERVEEVFPSASWQYVLYGMGFRPDAARPTRRPEPPALAEARFAEAAQLARRMLAGLPDNRTLIAHIRQHGLQALRAA